MSVSEEQKKIYFESRRREKEHFFSVPFYKRVIGKIEHLNKRLTLGLLGKVLRIKPITGKLSLDDISSVLILRYDAIGDMVVTSPLWRILKDRKPDLKIGVAGSSRNIDILRFDKDIDDVYNFSLLDKDLQKEELRKARSKQYDLVIACISSQKTRIATLARKASSNGVTASLVSDQDSPHNKIFSLTAILPQKRNPIPMVLQLQYLLENILDVTITDEESRPSIIVDPDILQQTKTATDRILSETQTTRYIVLNTESATAFREWGYENNYRLAKEIADARPETLVLLTSSPLCEKGLTDYLSQFPSTPNVQYFPTRGIHEMAALIRFSSLVISPDTSIIHIASAEAKPTVGFYVQVNPWLPFRVPAKVYIPKNGRPVSTIPVDLVKNGTLELLDTATSDPNTIDIFWCEEPLRSEQLTLDSVL